MASHGHLLLREFFHFLRPDNISIITFKIKKSISVWSVIIKCSVIMERSDHEKVQNIMVLALDGMFEKR